MRMRWLGREPAFALFLSAFAPKTSRVPRVRVRGITKCRGELGQVTLPRTVKQSGGTRATTAPSQPADPCRERVLPPSRNRAVEAARTNRQESRWCSLVWMTEDRQFGGRADRRPPGGSSASLWPKKRPGRGRSGRG